MRTREWLISVNASPGVVNSREVTSLESAELGEEEARSKMMTADLAEREAFWHCKIAQQSYCHNMVELRSIWREKHKLATDASIGMTEAEAAKAKAREVFFAVIVNGERCE